MTKPAPGFGDRLRVAIERSGRPKAEVARSARVSRPTLDTWLAGGLPRSRDQVEAVASVLGVSVDQLWGEAPLSAAERTRLMELEQLVAEMRTLLRRAGEAPQAPPERFEPSLRPAEGEEEAAPGRGGKRAG